MAAGKGRGARLVLAALLIGGVGVAALAATRPRSASKGSAGGQAGSGPQLPTSATGPVVPVGVATGYGQAQLVDTGAIDYSHMPVGWADWAGPVTDDWTRWTR